MARHVFKKVINPSSPLRIYQSISPLMNMQIEHHHVMLYLTRSCPSYMRPMQRYIRRTNTRLIHVMLGEFAKHLLKLYKNNDTGEFPDVAFAIKILFIRGTDYVKYALTGCLLETIKIYCYIENIDPEEFVKYLKPVSIRYWKSINQHDDE